MTLCVFIEYYRKLMFANYYQLTQESSTCVMDVVRTTVSSFIPGVQELSQQQNIDKPQKKPKLISLLTRRGGSFRKRTVGQQ